MDNKTIREELSNFTEQLLLLAKEVEEFELGKLPDASGKEISDRRAKMLEIDERRQQLRKQLDPGRARRPL